MQKNQRFTKASLQKALKERLGLLTEGLGQAEMGAKGIDLVKEMKELHAMLEHVLGEQKASAKAETSASKDAPLQIILSWGEQKDDKAGNSEQGSDEKSSGNGDV